MNTLRRLWKRTFSKRKNVVAKPMAKPEPMAEPEPMANPISSPGHELDDDTLPTEEVRDVTVAVDTTEKPPKKKRCPKGTRRNKQGDCVPYQPKQIIHLTEPKIPSPKETLLQPVSVQTKSPKQALTPQEQVDDYNQVQDKFTLTFHRNAIYFHERGAPSNSTECAKIVVERPDHILLDRLNKCGSMSGTQVLQHVEKFAKKYGYKTIELEDDARIESTGKKFRNKGGRCEIVLPILHILATGETWYNKMGYRSKTYDREHEHNTTIIQRPFVEFIRTIAKKENYEANKTPDSPTTEELIGGMATFTKTVDANISVQELFSKIMTRLRRQPLVCDDPDNPWMDWVLDVLQFIFNRGALQYSISKAKPYNIVYLRGMPDTNQFKEL